MKNSFKTKTLLAIIGFMALFGSVVFAGFILPILPNFDAKTFHGGECQPVFGSQANFFNYYFNRIQHIGPGTRPVSCPIVRDHTTNTDGTFGTSIDVNNVAGQRVQCILFSLDTQGAVVAANMKSTTLAGGPQTLRPDVNLSQSMGYYNLYCHLPQGSSIYGYKINEPFGFSDPDHNRTDFNR